MIFIKEDKKGVPKLAFMLSLVALVLAAVVSLFQINLWLAGTQWILIAILLGSYAAYFNGCNCACCENKDKE